MPVLPVSYLDIVLIIWAIGITVGGFFAVRDGRRAKLTQFQKDTIEAMQQRIDLLESEQETLKEKNIEQQYQLNMISDALKKKGIIITFDGDMLVLEGPGNQQSILRKPTRKTTTTTSNVTTKKTEEGN